MKAGWVGLTEFYSHNCFEECAVTLIKGLRVVIRELTQLNFFLSSSFDKSYMIRGTITPSPLPTSADPLSACEMREDEREVICLTLLGISEVRKWIYFQG